MHPLHRLVLIAALAGALSACSSSPIAPATSPPPAAAAPAAPEVAAPDPKVLGLWKIEQARAAPLLFKLNARIDFGPGGKLSGNGGCNGFMGSYLLSANRLKLGPVATTRKACNDALMEQEDRVLTALERAAGARVPGHGFLELIDADGTVLLRGSRLDAPAQ